MPARQTTKNPVVRRFRAVAAGQEPGLMVAEGTRLVGEVLDAGCAVEAFAWSPRLLERDGGEELLARLRVTGAEVIDASDRLLEQLSHLTTHQGVAVILRRPEWTDADLIGTGAALVVAAAGLRDPGNLGAVLRAAEAAGATGVLTTEGSADPFRDKAVRGSAGSVLRLPCRAGVTENDLVAWAQQHGLHIVVAENGSDTRSWDADLARPTLLVIGAEGAGVPDALRAAADQRVSIPIADSVESLNVAVAAGVLLFEARRQREGA